MKNSSSTGKSANGKKTDKVLAHYWHPVAWSRDLADKPLAVKLLDRNVVLWRTEHGVAGELLWGRH
ncbi:MAG: hypothetical protein FJ145_05090 [Deltaproteobacteria bacterium]|nr:hypothetical protein [Deltaproteobacteria bacterium]